MNDWEIELAVIIGKAARRVDGALAMDYVAGYSIINDVSARDWVASSPKFLGIDWVTSAARITLYKEIICRHSRDGYYQTTRLPSQHIGGGNDCSHRHHFIDAARLL
jgi:hypothetical protein